MEEHAEKAMEMQSLLAKMVAVLYDTRNFIDRSVYVKEGCHRQYYEIWSIGSEALKSYESWRLNDSAK